MSAPKFTPGPWATHPDRPTQVMDCADESFIADCEGLEPGGCPSDGANARLVAAAPELYGALESLVHAVEAARWPLTAEQMAPLNTARAALANAAKDAAADAEDEVFERESLTERRACEAERAHRAMTEGTP